MWSVSMANCTSSSRIQESDAIHQEIHGVEFLEQQDGPQAAQKFRPARPQRVKARGVPLRYVEGLNDARTKLAEFLSSLLLISHRLIELRQTRTRQRELGLYLDARRYQDRRME